VIEKTRATKEKNNLQKKKKGGNVPDYEVGKNREEQ